MNETRRIRISGRVQGVGFRPFVYRLATELGLAGEVCNRSSDVSIVVQGREAALDAFETRLRQQAPGELETLSVTAIDAAQYDTFDTYDTFTIQSSQPDSGFAVALLADRGICEQCRQEFLDPGQRRYRYPFINCTGCGPRYSICARLPFDRANTSWQRFPLCAACQHEFQAPDDRRFHAVGISCPACGPALFTPGGSRGAAALAEIAGVLDGGGIVAVKGMAGFHLLADAGNTQALANLRHRKRRSKPFALLAPDLAWIEDHAELSETERRTLRSSVNPVVLLQSRSPVAEAVAPGTGMMGVMLPGNGIQLALQQHLARPLVATSGNFSGSPLLFDNEQALQVLKQEADGFLLHDLELTQGLDDSVIRVMNNRPVNLRLGRGLAPQLHKVPGSSVSIGCGAQLKASVAIQVDETLVAGPHVGDLDEALTRQRYRQQKQHLPAFLQRTGLAEITDLHPDYGSTVDADYRARTVPHHIAHAMAAWLEHQPSGPFMALTWDGIGLGPDGTVWGGECLQFDETLHWQRLGSVLPFPLPAGHAIARYPGKVARVLQGQTLPGKSIACSSMGRLVEGLASLAGLREENQHEAQIAMEWEALAWQADSPAAMDFAVEDNNLDWRPLLPVLAESAIPLAARAAGFHHALARAAIRQCRAGNGRNVLLSGGVFQNRLLVELLVYYGQQAGFGIHPPERIPPNDGGIATGQCVAVAMNVARSQSQTQTQTTEIESCAWQSLA